MSKRRLDQYKGRLDAEQVAGGMNAARRNAERLAADAALLLDSGRFPSAAALAALSIEEAGKLSILRGLAVAGDDKEANGEWRSYRRHTEKNVQWFLPALVAAGARHLDDFAPLFDDDAEHPFLLDQVKQIAVYTDCLGDAHWSIPEEVLDGSLARVLVETAQLLCRGKMIATEEIELWIKHMGPVWKRSSGWMRKAVVAWHEEMKELGLATDDEDMGEFVFPDKEASPSADCA